MRLGKQGEDVANELMRAIRKLARDLHPADHEIDRFGLDDGLDERFRLDSLGRAELMLRLERLFDVRLPDALRASARTPRDILEALSKAEARVAVRSVSVVAPPTAGPSEIKPVPKSIKNLPDGLARYEKHQPNRPP